MKAYNHKPVDRSDWAPGPWWDELDEHAWVAHGLHCWLFRNSFGAWCGYVGVPLEHPIPQGFRHKVELKVHWGITYDKFNPDNQLFWLGFDCSHCEDLLPAKRMRVSIIPDLIYRDFNYALTETECLAEQLSTMEANLPPHPYVLSPEGYARLRCIIDNEYSFCGPSDLAKIFATCLTPLDSNTIT